jgi:hypothetical protein
MASKQLQSVSFFISLPSSIDVPAGVSFPLVEIDDGSEPIAIRFTDKDGINKRFNMHITVHQVASTINLSDTDACFSVFKELYSGQAEQEEITDTKDVKVDTKITVVQVACIRERKPLNGEIMSELFDKAIDAIRRYLKAYHMVTQQLVQLPTRQTTSAFVPYAVEDIDDQGEFIGQRASFQRGMFITHPIQNVSSIGTILSIQDINNIAHTSSTYLGNVLDQFYNVRREALLSYDSGNTIVAGILLGMAAEILLDELLLMLLWEEGVLPHEAREIFKNEETDTAFKRVKSGLYQKRIGGDWSTGETGVIHKWRYHVLELRNKIAHIGYEPTQNEMQEGQDTLVELVKYIADLLCANLEKYPVCADLIVGHSGMERRGCRKLFEEIIKDLPYLINPQRTFGNWKFEIERLARENPFVGSYKKSVPVYLVHANGDQMWLLLDEKNRLVKRIPDQTIANSKQRAGLDKTINIAITQRKGQSTLIELQNFRPKYNKVAGSEWTPLYMVSDQRNISRWPVSYLPPK